MCGGSPKSEEAEKPNHQVIHGLTTEEKGPGPLEVEVPQGCWISVGHNELKRREETRRRRSRLTRRKRVSRMKNCLLNCIAVGEYMMQSDVIAERMNREEPSSTE